MRKMKVLNKISPSPLSSPSRERTKACPVLDMGVTIPKVAEEPEVRSQKPE
jgi:hypothetical protein